MSMDGFGDIKHLQHTDPHTVRTTLAMYGNHVEGQQASQPQRQRLLALSGELMQDI